jgi:hypothetical protein
MVKASYMLAMNVAFHMYWQAKLKMFGQLESWNELHLTEPEDSNSGAQVVNNFAMSEGSDQDPWCTSTERIVMPLLLSMQNTNRVFF